MDAIADGGGDCRGGRGGDADDGTLMFRCVSSGKTGRIVQY